jgi:sigma-B regulation protein RsbU (phosphoserine phosphatase)
LDSKGELIARPGIDAGDTKWDEAYVTENFLQCDNRALREIALDMVSGRSGIGRCEFGHGKKYIAYAPIAHTGWSLGIVMPVEDIIAPAMETKDEMISDMAKTDRDINQRIRHTQNTIVCIFICVILAVFLVANKLSKKITRPISLLNNGAKIVGGGNLDYHLEVKTGDEIEDLAGTFNKMTQDLKLYIKNLEETTAAKERTENELKIAHDIQMNILPKTFPPFPDRSEFDIYAVLDPAREVGGDFYDFFFIDNDHLCFVVGDVSGKGVPAALFMAMTKTLIKTITKEVRSPDIVLSKVNKEISHDNFSSMFVTVFCGILNIRTGEVYYTSGGHTPSLVVSGGEKAEFIEGANCAAVGAIENAVYKKGKLVLQPGDVIFLYTDGITEAVNTDGEMFSEERLKEEVSGCREVSVSALAGEILQKVERFSDGAPRADDITVMVLRYFGGTKKGETVRVGKNKRVILKNDTSEIGKLADAVAGFGKENSLTDDVIYDLNLALEEIVVNIISHGHEDKNEHQIIIYLELKDDEVILRVEDDGRPFDPMKIPEVDIEQPIEEREAGGLGIHLVRNLMDKVRYRREGGKNILIMSKTPVFRS